ncbi:hypothetical protein FHR33_006166 [Nonomuraea dietziae]|uniref:Uncharacterized protein n=2 Tax=Nonomuraea dietziae TaxID=65515 RepID=A0A7W5V4B3_9ACTN|nr:hypothetical protein [Nonomuraea dietziae]
MSSPYSPLAPGWEKGAATTGDASLAAWPMT